MIEFESRRKLAEFWEDSGHLGEDPYLDFLVDINRLEFLEEYVITTFARPGWTIPGPTLEILRASPFFIWARSNLARSELSVIYQEMELQGWPDLPPRNYVPPASQQLTTRCQNGITQSFPEETEI